MIEEGLSTIKTSAQARQAAIIQQLQKVDVSTKETDTAFLIELVASFFGFFGVGYIYSGLTNTGIVRLAGYLAYSWVLLPIVSGIIGTVTLGLGLCLILPIALIVHLALVWFSANDLKAALNAVKSGATGGVPNMGGTDGSSNFGGYIGSPPMDISAPTMPSRAEEPVYRSFSSDQPASGVEIYNTPSGGTTPQADTPGSFTGFGPSSNTTSLSGYDNESNTGTSSPGYSGPASSGFDTPSADYSSTPAADAPSSLSSAGTPDADVEQPVSAPETPTNTQAAFGAPSIDPNPPSDPFNQDDDNNPFNPDDLTKKV